MSRDLGLAIAFAVHVLRLPAVSDFWQGFFVIDNGRNSFTFKGKKRFLYLPAMSYLGF